jgi:predicted RNA-binding Zn-ribbon protein involved in translation (DUF1610 family)
VRIVTVQPTCPDCGVEAVRSDDSRFNVVYVCPTCDRQLACAYARE